MQRRVRIALVLMGFSGLVAEILLLRELLIVFSGNELSIGLILANWLILEAIGCVTLGRLADKVKNKLETYAIIAVLFSVALISAIFVTRILKNLLGVSIGEHVELLPMFYSSFLILLPVCILHGALFTIGCRIYSMFSVEDATSTGKVYVFETIGTVIGGIASTALLITHLHTFHITIGIALLKVISSLYLLTPKRIPANSEQRHDVVTKGTFNIVLRSGLGVLLLITVYALLGGPANDLHNQSLRIQWKDQNVVHYQNSHYGNISVLEDEGHYLFFLDGIPEIKTPIPDIQFIEEFVHLPLLAHPDPEELLILRGGAGGIINEALKHPSVRSIEYAEQDPMLLDIIRKHPTSLTESELTDERVHVEHTDGRLYLATTPKRYDLVFIGVMEPSNLQANRFYTQEFFKLAKEQLNEDGILVIGVPGSLTYLTDEIKNLNSNIYHTLNSVFSNVRVSPGENKHIYISSDSEDIMDLDLTQIMERLEKRDISTEGMVPWHIEQKMHEGWRQWFSDYIDGKTQQINHDFKPIGMFYHIAHWNTLHADTFGSYFNELEQTHLIYHILPILLFILLLYFIFRTTYSQYTRAAIPFAIFSTGFAGMIFSLIVIFMFQITYGHVFSWIGLLVAAFMAGAGAGALFITRIMEQVKSGRNLFLYLELAVIGFTIALPLIFFASRALPDGEGTLLFLRVLFLIFSFISGLVTGMPFPLANKLHLKNKAGLSNTAGLIYASDLLGGWLGGIVGGVVLLPILGLTETCIAVGMVKVTSFIIIATMPAETWKKTALR